MNEKIKKVTTVVKDKWTGFSKMVKAFIIAVPIAVIAIIIILVVIFNHKDRVVLYSGLTTEEAQSIAGVVNELGVTDVTIGANGDIVVPEDQVDYLTMQLAVRGYPSTGDNYDIYNNGIDLWSTDFDKREVARQQREARIRSMLMQLDAVRDARVTLDLPQEKDYVIVEDKKDPSCSVTLRLSEDKELTNAEVRAIFGVITNAVEGLTNDNLTVVDTQGRPYKWISEEEEKNGDTDASGVNVGRRRLEFERDYRAAIMADLKEFFDKPFGEGHYSVNVSTKLNYDNKKQTSTEYFPYAEGEDKGVLSHGLDREEGGYLENANGLVGETPNADTSPDYPNYIGLEDGQSYYYRLNENEYDVSNIVTEIEKDGYSIESLSVALLIDTNALTEAERQGYADILAKAAGTDVANVSVMNTVFPITNANGGNGSLSDDNFTGIHTQEPDRYRNVLLYVVIALGILLILLLILSLLMSRSRKRKIRRRQEMALAAAASGSMGASAQLPEQPQEVDFNIASLTEEAGKESRETILKREISDFSKNSPEIVALIIKNMLRED